MSDTTHDKAHDDAHGDHGTGDDYYVHAHISPTKFYAGIFAVLIFFTLLTVGISRIHLGPLNLAVAVIIASMKASLVVLFFMHLKYDSKFNGLIFISTLMFIGVFFAYTLNDTGHRGEVDSAQGTYTDPVSGKEAPGGLQPMPKALGSSAHGAEGAPQLEHPKEQKQEHH